MAEWEISARVKERVIEWTFDQARDAKKAWRHIERTNTTPDTGQRVEAASIRKPDGHVFYLGEKPS